MPAQDRTVRQSPSGGRRDNRTAWHPAPRRQTWGFQIVRWPTSRRVVPTLVRRIGRLLLFDQRRRGAEPFVLNDRPRTPKSGGVSSLCCRGVPSLYCCYMVPHNVGFMVSRGRVLVRGPLKRLWLRVGIRVSSIPTRLRSTEGTRAAVTASVLLRPRLPRIWLRDIRRWPGPACRGTCSEVMELREAGPELRFKCSPGDQLVRA